MKTIFLLGAFLLSGCGLAVTNFDQMEYEHAVNIRYQLADVAGFCASQDAMKAGLVPLQKEVNWVSIYASGFPENGEVVIMLGGLKDEVDRFAKIVNAPKVPSKIYCYDKLNNLNAAATMILHAEASKSR